MALIGIDLGTTNSLGAVYRNGKVELIPNRYGSFLTPSVVSLEEDGTIEVGMTARERLITHPDRTASSFKQDMGTDRKRKLGDREFTPEELSSFVIRSILQDADSWLSTEAERNGTEKESITEAVISVPAYFQDRQRVAVKQAGALAGAPVNRIVNEPSAAAFAAYMEQGQAESGNSGRVISFRTREQAKSEQQYLVFDFGGGTLDVSLVSCIDTLVEITAVAGNNHLGGDNINAAVAEWFMEEHGLRRNQFNDREFAALIREAEKCKIALSDKKAVKMTVTVSGETLQSELNGQIMLGACRDIFKEIRNVAGEALRAGSKTASEMDAVVLAGGSSRMPLVQSFLHHLFKGVPLFCPDPDKMIVRGVGYVCGMMQHEEELEDYVMTDICPFTLGTAVINRTDGNRDYMSAIIPKNSVLPVSRSHIYSTSVDNQKGVDLRIYQGEHPYVKDNVFLGNLMFAIPPRRKGEVVVQVRFTYDINGILIVDATVQPGGKTYSKVISQTYTGEELEKKVQELEKLRVSPKDEDENRLIREKLQAVYESSGGALKETAGNALAQFDAVLAGEDPVEIHKFRMYLRDFLGQIREFDPFSDEKKLHVYRSEDYSDNGSGGDGDDGFDWDNL